MSSITHIGVFHSGGGSHLLNVLRYLKSQYPGAALTALVPEDYPQGSLEGLADRMVIFPPGFMGRLRRIRAGRYDLLVVMSESMRDRWIARIGGSQARYAYLPQELIIPIARIPFLTTAPAWLRRIRGAWLHARLRREVSQSSVEMEQDQDT